MASRNKLSFYYFTGAVALFVVGYGLAWFSEQPLFSKEVFPKGDDRTATVPAPSGTPAADDDAAPSDTEASVRPGRQYEVQPGDTISSVAEANGLDFEALAEYNGIPYPYNLAVGQIIVIPEGSDE
ncbi:MAG: LysM peptidoglycan-binding domain-containing protein [bacterium]|nr:LysM peptidoglycan-binding domain-containing protein [bacterium]